MYILGDPKVSVVAFGSKSKSVNIYQVGDGMGKRGWHLNALSDPGALHMAFTVSLTDYPLFLEYTLIGLATFSEECR